jgi:hydrogenase maturation protein HypF
LKPESNITERVAFLIKIEGLVQGVGFRPFVYRLANELNITGWIVNRNDAVVIKAEGMPMVMPLFIESLRTKAPVIAQIDEMTIENDFPENFNEFLILASQDLSAETSEISPDIAVCNDCLADLKKQPHRINYPFINCTNCGPRFSIIFDFPYDRDKTTMNRFAMCPVCTSEYTDILNRRFHAQPVACNNCGPHYTLYHGNTIDDNFSSVLQTLARLINDGKIIAIKGIGGFHLMCDAFNEKTVKKLRGIKLREGKPFAVMFRDIAAVKKFAQVSEEEKSILNSWQRPVVLLMKKAEPAESICMGLNTIGAFLPYMPAHYLLFEKLKTQAFVLTSGNLADEPIIIDDLKALNIFGKITDAVVTYNREIFNRTDDSVIRFINGKERIFRRSRGYAPSPVKLPFDVNGILATGAELSNCFCIGKGNRAFLSQHIGDLKNYETYEFYTETIERFKKIFRFTPHLIAADMHPDYLSTRYAEQQGIDCIKIQHHHAHIVACMAEYGLKDKVIGVCFDGTGYGTDGNIWGGEFLIADYCNFKRYTHFDYLPLPGGDKAVRENWRTGISLLYKTFGNDMVDLDIPFIRNMDKKLLLKIIGSIEKKINVPLSSGCGRLFDGIAAITGVCSGARFHAEAPMKLESAVMPGIKEYYEVALTSTIRFESMIKQIVSDVQNNISANIISARFHNTIIWTIFETVKRIRKETGLSQIVLSGGSFQNKYLTENVISMLSGAGMEVYLAAKVPYNDGGIALGQLVVAAKLREG